MYIYIYTYTHILCVCAQFNEDAIDKDGVPRS